jgi:cell division protein FtsB
MTWPPSSEYRRLQACRDQAEENHTQALIRRVQAYDAEHSAAEELKRCRIQLEHHIKNLTDPK